MLTVIPLIIGGLLGICFGLGEALWRRMRIAQRDPRNLPHGWLLTARLAMATLVAWYVLPFQQLQLLHELDPAWHSTPSILRTTGIVMVALTMLHRVVFNIFSGQAVWYMGDVEHKPGDSVYDTIMWTLASLFFVGILRRWHPAHPWVMATAIERTALILLIRW